MKGCALSGRQGYHVSFGCAPSCCRCCQLILRDSCPADTHRCTHVQLLQSRLQLILRDSWSVNHRCAVLIQGCRAELGRSVDRLTSDLVVGLQMLTAAPMHMSSSTAPCAHAAPMHMSSNTSTERSCCTHAHVIKHKHRAPTAVSIHMSSSTSTVHPLLHPCTCRQAQAPCAHPQAPCGHHAEHYAPAAVTQAVPAQGLPCTHTRMHAGEAHQRAAALVAWHCTPCGGFGAAYPAGDGARLPVCIWVRMRAS